MNIVESLVAKNNKTNKSKRDKINSLQSQINDIEHEIHNSHEFVFDEIKRHYLNHPEENICFKSLFSYFEDEQITDLLLNILKVRTLREDEITPDLIALIESLNSKDLFEAFANTFSSLSKELKTSIALSCHGYGNLAELCSYMGKHLTDNYGVYVTYPKDKNYIKIDDVHDRVTSENYIQVVTHEGCNKGLRKIAKNIIKILDDGYKNNLLNIFENTLSRFGSCYLIVRDENGEVCTPIVEGHTNRYISKGENIEEQMLDALKYISKNYWYSTDRDEEQEESW